VIHVSAQSFPAAFEIICVPSLFAVVPKAPLEQVQQLVNNGRALLGPSPRLLQFQQDAMATIRFPNDINCQIDIFQPRSAA
jgi:hypothetical protein